MFLKILLTSFVITEAPTVYMKSKRELDYPKYKHLLRNIGIGLIIMYVMMLKGSFLISVKEVVSED